LITGARRHCHLASRITGVYVSLCLTLLTWTVVDAAQLPKQSQGISALNVDLPVTGREWLAVIGGLASRDRIPAGIEIAPGAAMSKFDDEPNTMLVLSGLRFDAAINLIIEHDQRYTVTRSNGLLNVRPTSSLNMRDDFLNRRISRFEATNVSVLDMLDRIHRELNPNHRSRHRELHLQRIREQDPKRADAIQFQIHRPITVSLANVSIRDILNAVVAANGEIWWSVTYQSHLGSYEECTIAFAGFDNWRVAVSAWPRNRG
jgi:hypothetical protein